MSAVPGAQLLAGEVIGRRTYLHSTLFTARILIKAAIFCAALYEFAVNFVTINDVGDTDEIMGGVWYWIPCYPQDIWIICSFAFDEQSSYVAGFWRISRLKRNYAVWTKTIRGSVRAAGMKFVLSVRT